MTSVGLVPVHGKLLSDDKESQEKHHVFVFMISSNELIELLIPVFNRKHWCYTSAIPRSCFFEYGHDLDSALSIGLI
jgi:hypothetical protein